MRFVPLTILFLLLAAPAPGLPVHRESEIFDPSSGEATDVDFSVLHLDLVGTDDLFGPGHPRNEPGLEMALSGAIVPGSGARLSLTLDFDVPVVHAASIDDPDLTRGIFSWSPDEGVVTMTAFDFEYVGSLRIAFEQRPTAVEIRAILLHSIPGGETGSFGIRWPLRNPGRASRGATIAPAPEPSTGLLLALGLVGVALLRIREPG